MLSELQIDQVIQQLKACKAVAAIAREFNVSRQTIMRIRDSRHT